MKYVMLETSEGEKIPVIFAESLVHANVADVIKRVIHYERRGGLEINVASAGFVGFHDTPTVAGESESLGGKRANPLDGFRMQAGTSVSHMPDAMLEPLERKARTDAKIKSMYPDQEQPHPDDAKLAAWKDAMTEKLAVIMQGVEEVRNLAAEPPHRLQQFLFRLLRDHPEIDFAAHLAQTEHEVAVYHDCDPDMVQGAMFLASELVPQ